MERSSILIVALVVALAGCASADEAAAPSDIARESATEAATPQEGDAPTETPASDPEPTAEEQTTEDTSAATESTAEAGPPVELPGTVQVHGTTQVAGGEARVAAQDVFFEPTFVEGQPGQTVAVTVTNEGSIDHTFTIEDQGIDEVLAPGDETTVEVTVPEGGSARFVCRFHVAGGMQGALYPEGG
jgi:plastocyanin